MPRARCLVVASICAAGLAAACHREEPHQKPLVPVRVHAVQEQAPAGGVRFSATIEPSSRVALAWRVGGYVRELLQVPTAGGGRRPVQDGDRVTSGTVLARLREGEYEAKVGQARAQLTEAVALDRQARSDFSRAQALLASASTTKADYDAARARMEAADAKVTGGRAVLAEAESALSDCALRAPMAATVLKRDVEVGSLVAPGTLAFVLADTSSVEALFAVPDVVVQGLGEGSPLTLTSDAFPNTELAGRITRIAPSADPASRSFEVEVTIPNPDGRLKPGMIAALEVERGAATLPLVVVPLTAIVRPPGKSAGYAVYVVGQEDGKDVVHARAVELGEPQGNQIAVTAGLKPGERVVVAGATLVVDGQPVRVAP